MWYENVCISMIRWRESSSDLCFLRDLHCLLVGKRIALHGEGLFFLYDEKIDVSLLYEQTDWILHSRTNMLFYAIR